MVDLRSTLRDALMALGQNRLRAVLSILGIAIGISAVVSTVAVGQGARARVQEQLEAVGDNMIWIEAGGRTVSGRRTGNYGTKTLTLGDAQAISGLSLIRVCSPHVDAHVQVAYGNHNWNTHYRGVAPAFLEIRRWPVAVGTGFTQAHVDHLDNVCLLGPTVVTQLFGTNSNPVGETIRVGNLPFRVLGVLAPKGVSGYGFDQDDVIILPYTTAMKKLAGQDWLNDIMCSAISPAAVAPAEQQITLLLRQRHRLFSTQPDDFNIRHPEDALRALDETNRTFALMLASIASVSLLVGGIGIMNIMLVSVTERTREIGIRMAVGASRRDVRRQFLIEALLISLLGGALGVLLAVGAASGLGRLIQWPALFSWQAVAVAVAFSVATGIFFGYYPARKAAALDPIEALRYE
jgi:putative ABC transport system permease protein